MGLHLLPGSYPPLRAHETDSYLVCRLLLEKKKENTEQHYYKHLRAHETPKQRV